MDTILIPVEVQSGHIHHILCVSCSPNHYGHRPIVHMHVYVNTKHTLVRSMMHMHIVFSLQIIHSEQRHVVTYDPEGYHTLAVKHVLRYVSY